MLAGTHERSGRRAMNEQNRLRLERIAQRYDRRVSERDAPEESAFVAAFEQLCDRLLRPKMEEVAAELRRAGHESRVVVDAERQAIELVLGLRRGKGSRNVVGFCVLRWTGYPLQILAYLEISPPPFDIERFAAADEIAPERVEQLLVDAVEQILSVNAS